MSIGGSIAQVVLGVVLTVLIPGNPIGLSMIVSGVLSAAAIAMTPNERGSDGRASPTYGFSNFQNPVKGDTSIPIIYSKNGHKIAPIWLQAFVTPRGHYDEEFWVHRRARGQALSGLLAVGEGPLEDIYDIRFNDEKVYSEVEGREIGTGNGSKKVFEIDAENIELTSIRLTVGSTDWGFTLSSLNTQVGSGNGSKQLFLLNLKNPFAMERGIRLFTQDPARTDAAIFEMKPDDPNPPGGISPRCWARSKTEICINTQAPYPNNWALWAQVYVWITPTGVKIEKVEVTDSKGNTKDLIRITFTTAPTSGQKLVVAYRRKVMGGVKTEIRFGTNHQLPILGFDNIRNTYGVNQELRQTWIEHESVDEVDDLILDIGTGPSGFGEYDEDDGDLGSTYANFEVEVKRVTALGTNSFNSWVRLKDVQPARKNKTATEFSIVGASASQLFDAVSIRGVLTRFLERNPKDATAQKLVTDFQRARYAFRVHRVGPVRADTSSQHVDNIYWFTWQEIIDEFLSYSGTGLLAFHALGTERTNGSAPNITCRSKGVNSIPHYTTANGGEWRTTDASKMGNRVWAICDLITNKRYGAGEHYSTANIDATSAKEVADALDAQVPKEAGSTETEIRSELDIVLDVRRPLMEHIRDIAQPGRFWVVMQGQKFYFVLDDPVTLLDSVGADAVPVIYDDTKLARTAQNTLVFSRPSVAERPTELQVIYLDATANFDQKEIWVSLKDKSSEVRRITRAQGFGIIRKSEATRYSAFLYDQLRVRGPIAVVGVSPAGLHFTAGMVIRVISDRGGVSGYWRIRRISFSSTDFFCRLDLQVYEPSVYAANGQQLTILTVGANTLRTQSAIGAPSSGGGSPGRMAVRARRLA